MFPLQELSYEYIIWSETGYLATQKPDIRQNQIVSAGYLAHP